MRHIILLHYILPQAIGYVSPAWGWIKVQSMPKKIMMAPPAWTVYQIPKQEITPRAK